jgi:hypothetical protein
MEIPDLPKPYQIHGISRYKHGWKNCYTVMEIGKLNNIFVYHISLPFIFFSSMIVKLDGQCAEQYNDGRFGVVVGILAYYARGRGFDSRTVQTFVCMNMSVCIGSGCFYV